MGRYLPIKTLVARQLLTISHEQVYRRRSKLTMDCCHLVIECYIICNSLNSTATITASVKALGFSSIKLPLQMSSTILPYSSSTSLETLPFLPRREVSSKVFRASALLKYACKKHQPTTQCMYYTLGEFGSIYTSLIHIYRYRMPKCT